MSGEATLDLLSLLRRTPLTPLGHAKRCGRPGELGEGPTLLCQHVSEYFQRPSARRARKHMAMRLPTCCHEANRVSYLLPSGCLEERSPLWINELEPRPVEVHTESEQRL